MNPTQINPVAINAAKAIRQQESGGNYSLPGKSGEYGAYQFTEPTWNSYAGQYGINVPLKQATREQQNEVVTRKINDWISSGKAKNIGEIASMWNAGEGKPQAYLENNVGTNEYGVHFDTPAYAKAVAEHYQQFKSGQNQTSPDQSQTIPEQKQTLESEGQPVSTQTDRAKPTGIGNFIRNNLRLPAEVGTNIQQFGETLAGQPLTEPFSGKYLGRVQPLGADPNATVQEGTSTASGGRLIKSGIAAGLEAGSYVVGGEGIGAIGKAGLSGLIKQGALQGLKEGAISGALSGVGSGLENNKSIGNIALQGVGGAAAGGILGGTLGTIVPTIGYGANKAIDSHLGIKIPIADTKFESKVNQAFPVLKKDVGNLSKKADNIHTALSDIVANKNNLGFTDKYGTPRLPKTFAETVDAQNTRLPQIYKAYTEKLEGVDGNKFHSDITTAIKGQIKSVDDQLKKENSIDGRRALTKIKTELGSLRDTSPLGIQNYIQSINQHVKPSAPGGSLTTEQIKYANLGGQMRKILDDSVSKIDGKGYQELRSTYAAHKALQSQLLMAAKKEINGTPGFTDKLTNAGMTAEGLNFLITHDPHSLAVAGALKFANKISKWTNSPEAALKGLFSDVEKGYKRPSPSSPLTINHIAKSEPKNINIDSTIPTINKPIKPLQNYKTVQSAMNARNRGLK